MDISSLSSSSVSAGSLQGGQIASQISAAVMKQTMESQQRQGEALVQMIQATTPSLEGTGRLVDVRA